MNKVKTAIFFSHRYVEFYHLDRIKNRSDYRLILISDSSIKQSKIDFYGLFDEVHIISSKISAESYCYELEYGPAAKIIQAEIAKLVNSRNCRLLCVTEANMLTAAKLRDDLAIPGAGVKDILPFRNKIRMKEIVNHAGLRVPHFQAIDAKQILSKPESYYKTLETELKLPFIIKPMISVACNNVYKVWSLDDFYEFCLNEKDSLEQFEAEEFISGTFIHCDNIKKGSRYIFSECSAYTCPALDFHSSTPHGSMRLTPEDAMREKIINFSQKALLALGLPDGSSHLELFLTPDNEIIFIEAAARIPGLLMVKMYEKSTGINMLDEELRVHTGWDLEQLPVEISPCFWLLYPMIQGRISSCQSPEIKSNYSIEWKVNNGDLLQNSACNLDIAAQIVVWNKDSEQLLKDYEAARRHQAIEVKPMA